MSAIVMLPARCAAGGLHPNDVERKRIERTLGQRKRYRYVRPRVRAVAGGYLIDSPCCSRNIDADGEVVDIALLLYGGEPQTWELYARDHRAQKWCWYASYVRISDLLGDLNADKKRVFWK